MFGEEHTGTRGIRVEGGAELVRIAFAALVVALLLVGFGTVRASDRDEAAVTVKVTSAPHELEEGYFSLGDSATLITKPGSDLHRFLARQRGNRIRIVLAEEEHRELSQLRR